MSEVETTIEALRKRHDTLSHKKTEAETDLRNAQKRLRELQEEAVKAYGTSDLAELRKKLKEMQEENERKTVEYQKHLDEIEDKLREIESDERVPSIDHDDIDEKASDDVDPFADE